MCHGTGQATGGGASWKKSFGIACCLCTGHPWDRRSKNRVRGESGPSTKRGVKIFDLEVPLEDPERWALSLSFDELRGTAWSRTLSDSKVHNVLADHLGLVASAVTPGLRPVFPLLMWMNQEESSQAPPASPASR